MVQGTSLDLHISVYVTCLCNPDAVPPIDIMDLGKGRPSIFNVLHELVTPPDVSVDATCEKPSLSSRLQWAGLGGGVGVCASGPESLITETQNAVARMGVSRGVELGGIGLHTELFAL